MLDDWRITWTDRDLPLDAWDFLKANRFFGMIIPKAYGGLGFSAYAHSEVVRKISTRSVAAAVVTMVPNSLGPGELLMQFGTDAQRDYWLPRLADGREIPCFGLTIRSRIRRRRHDGYGYRLPGKCATGRRCWAFG